MELKQELNKVSYRGIMLISNFFEVTVINGNFMCTVLQLTSNYLRVNNNLKTGIILIF